MWDNVLVCESKRNPNYAPFLCTLPSKSYFWMPHQVFDFGSSTYWHLDWHSRTPQSQEDPPPSWCTSVHVVFPALDQQSPPCLWIDWLASFMHVDATKLHLQVFLLIGWRMLENFGPLGGHRVTSLPTNTHYLLFKHRTLCQKFCQAAIVLMQFQGGTGDPCDLVLGLSTTTQDESGVHLLNESISLR